MGSRIREKPAKIFEVFVEIAKSDSANEVPFVIQQYPPDYDDKETMMMIPKFAYPCETDSSQVDHFTFVLTDLEGMFRFGYCRYSNGHRTCLCILSCLPWSEIFYRLLNQLAEITNQSDNSGVLDLMKVTYNHQVPAPTVPVTIVSREQMFSFTTPDPTVLPSIPSNRYLTEYYNAVDANNMMTIFASMLHERRIYMTSRKLSRLTACIHASESLLYPMHWQHLYIPVLPAHLVDYISAPMPYIIGVHTNLMQKVTINQADIGDVVRVDLDANTVESDFDDLALLPTDVSNYLRKNLKSEVVKKSMDVGDAIPKAFLLSLVRLIGGYREGLKIRNGEPITFDPEKFVMTRQSQRSRAFLESMLTLQIFQQFIKDRLEVLNAGGGHTGLFEDEATFYADKKRKQYNIKDKYAKNKKKGKEMLSVFKGKAAPMMSSAVISLKDRGKKAMGKFQEWTDYQQPSQKTFNPKGGIVHTKLNSEKPDQNVPPRPPITYKSKGKDKTDAILSYHPTDMTLFNDADLQSMSTSSASLDINSEDWSDSSSVSSDSAEDADSGNIPFGQQQSSDEGLDGLISPDREVEFADAVPANNFQEDKLIRPAKKLSSQPGVRLTAPVAPPRARRSPNTSPNLQTSRKTVTLPRDSAVPRPLPRTNSLKNTNNANKQDSLLIQFDSADSADSDIFDPLTFIGGPAAADSAKEGNSDSISRNRPSRNSLSRTKAFRRDSVGKQRSSMTDNNGEMSDDLLGDLAGINLSGAPESKNPSASPRVSHSGDAARRPSVDLMQEWSLASLPQAPTITLPMTGHPAPGLVQLTSRLQQNQNPGTNLTRYSSYSYNSIRPNTVAGSPFVTGAIINSSSPGPRFPSAGAPLNNSTPYKAGSPLNNPAPHRAGNPAANRLPSMSVNNVQKTGVNKLPDDLFSEFMPSFGANNDGGQSAQAKVPTSAQSRGLSQGVTPPPPQQQKWTTFD